MIIIVSFFCFVTELVILDSASKNKLISIITMPKVQTQEAGRVRGAYIGVAKARCKKKKKNPRPKIVLKILILSKHDVLSQR